MVCMSVFKNSISRSAFFMLVMNLLFSQPCFSQEESSKIQWQDVTLLMMKDKSAYPKFELKAEWVLRRLGSIQSLEDLSDRKIKKIKKHAARLNCRWAFIRGTRSESLKGLYYVMGK